VEAGYGIQIAFTGVPGAAGYNIYYFDGSALHLEGTYTPAQPGLGGTFPATPPLYLNVGANTYFVVKAVVGGMEGLPGNAQPVFTTACSAPSS
jgi:hypothetical protein